MLKPFISIVMPAFNACKFIEESIDSVLIQTYGNWELIVVDDGSIDNTASKVKGYQSYDERIKYIYQENRGLGGARNTAINAAIGQFIAFLDSDDIWSCEKLQKQIDAFQSNPQVDVIFTDGYIFYDDDLSKLTPYPTCSGIYGPDEMYRLQYKRNNIPVLSVMVKKEYIDKIGLQDVSKVIHGCEDWDYWIRMAKAGATFLGLEDKLFYYRIHSSNMSGNRIQMRMAEFFALYKNLDFEIFDENGKEEVRQRFDSLIRFIINELYVAKDSSKILYYMKILKEIKGSFKYKYAELMFRLLGLKSKRLVNFILYH